MSKQLNNEKQKVGEDSYWNKIREFNLTRTRFGWLVLWQLIETIIPFILVWVFVGPELKKYHAFNHYNDLLNPHAGFLALICLAILLWAWTIQIVSFFYRWQNADSFTFTLIFSLVFFTLIMNGCWLVDSKLNLSVQIIIRFLIGLFIAIGGLFLGVLVTSFARNYRYKVEEDEETLLLAYQNGEPIPTKAQLRLVRAQKNHEIREAQAKELDEFKKQLDAKLLDAFNNKTIDKHEIKLEAKEARKRERFVKRQAKKTKKEV